MQAARYNAGYMVPGDSFSKETLIPEDQAAMVTSVAQFVYVSFYPKGWPALDRGICPVGRKQYYC